MMEGQVLNLLANLAFTVFGVVFGYWWAGHRARPNLRVSGSGGSYVGMPTASITISNDPRFTGLRISASKIFGRRVHGPLVIGQTKHVEPADNCSARIISKNGGEHLSHLYWFNPGGKPSANVTIPSNKSASLLLFARIKEEYPKYFIYQPDRDGSANPKVPVDQLKFDNNMDFILEIRYNFGLLRHEVGVRLNRSTDQHLYFKMGGGLSAF
jgi:hypothetical protein